MIKFNTAYRASLKTRSMRRAEERGDVFKVVSVKKDGTLSKMDPGALNKHLSRERADERCAEMHRLNPGRKFVIV